MLTNSHRIAPAALLAMAAMTAQAQFAGFIPDIVTDQSAFDGAVVDMTTGDVNGDGVRDIVLIDTSGRVQYFPGVGSGQLAGGVVSVVNPEGSGLGRAIDLFDCDGDGRLDLMRTDSRDGGSLRIYKQDGEGGFIFDFAIINLGTISAFKGLSMGDYDSDGDQDAYILTDSGVTVVINQNGVFSFDPIVSTYINFDGRVFAVADINGDGRADAVAYSALNQQLYILEAGPLGLSDSGRIAFSGGVNDLKLFNIDSDTSPDLVVTGTSSNNKIAVYRNNAGSFELSYSVTEKNPDETEVADIDGDGDFDLIVEAQDQSFTNERAIIYTNNGEGFFTREPEQWFFWTDDVQEIEVVSIGDATGPDLIGVIGQSFDGPIVTLRLNATPFSAPGALSQATPADGSTDLALPGQVATWGGPVIPTLTWERTSGLGVTYTVRVDNDPSFSSPEFEASGLTGKSVDISSANLLQSTTYFWEVEANNTVGTTPSVNGPFSFLTAPGPSECLPDINGDGIVDQGDIQSFIALFLAGC